MNKIKTLNTLLSMKSSSKMAAPADLRHLEPTDRIFRPLKMKSLVHHRGSDRLLFLWKDSGLLFGADAALLLALALMLMSLYGCGPALWCWEFMAFNFSSALPPDFYSSPSSAPVCLPLPASTVWEKCGDKAGLIKASAASRCSCRQRKVGSCAVAGCRLHNSCEVSRGELRKNGTRRKQVSSRSLVLKWLICHWQHIKHWTRFSGLHLVTQSLPKLNLWLELEFFFSWKKSSSWIFYFYITPNIGGNWAATPRTQSTVMASQTRF